MQGRPVSQSGQVRPTLDIRREAKKCPACGQRFSADSAFCPFDGSKLEPGALDPSADPLVGRQVDGRYEVLALLGEGGMGQVYQVRHISLDRHFAMKLLRRELARDEELAARFIDEARATASIRHPNIVQITDFGKLAEGLPYFVMELLRGETLGRVIKAGGPIPAARAVRILEQVASALGAAHAAGVVHRDLKPENVFLVGGMAGGRASDDVRVVDFGAAKIVGSSRVTRQGIVFGTPHYMSPEQASGQPVDHRADIYALGVIMYEMFTGRVPFEADTYMGVLTQHMFVQPVPPSQVSPAVRELGVLEEITLTCLAKKPEERYATMADLGAALVAAMHPPADGGVEVAPRSARNLGRISAAPTPRFPMADELEPPTLEEMRVAIDSVSPPKSSPPWGWIAVVAALLVAALAIWALLGRGPAPATAAMPPAPPAVQASTAASPIPTIPAAVAPSASASASAAAVVATALPSAAPAPPPARRTPSRPPQSMDDVGDPFAHH
jgi:eukaryotic-like serine/threonine-protein kinase